MSGQNLQVSKVLIFYRKLSRTTQANVHMRKFLLTIVSLLFPPQSYAALNNNRSVVFRVYQTLSYDSRYGVYVR